MKKEPDPAATRSNPAAAADAHQYAGEEIEERARVASRTLSRSWLARLAVLAVGLIAAWLDRRRRAARRASAR